MKKISVSVSGSSGIDDVRLAVQDLLDRLNRFFAPRGIGLVLAPPSGRPSEAGLAIALYWKDFGSFPQTDFDRAYASFKQRNAPKIYVFFKDPDTGISEALKSFKESFGDRYGHFFCRFETADSVRFQLTAQSLSLLPCTPAGEVLRVDGQDVLLGNEAIASVANLPFANLNANRRSLSRRIADAKKEIAELEDRKSVV